MNNLTKQILAFNPQKMDIATAQKTKRVISDELAESEKILKLAQCHPDIIKATPQLFFIKCNKLLKEQSKKLAEKEKKMKGLQDIFNNSDLNLDNDHNSDFDDEEDRFLSKSAKTNSGKNNFNDMCTTDSTNETAFDSKLESLENRFNTVYSIYEDISSIAIDQSRNLFTLNKNLDHVVEKTEKGKNELVKAYSEASGTSHKSMRVLVV